MISKFLILVLILNCGLCQYNGEFWWLDKKISKLTGASPSPIQFEEVGQFETDESDKIVFRDEELSRDDVRNENTNVTFESNSSITFKDHSKILWPLHLSLIKTNETETQPENPMIDVNLTITQPENMGDEFEFDFPSSEEKVTIINNNTVLLIPTQNITNKNEDLNVTYKDKIFFKEYEMETAAESICSHMKKHECSIRKGTVYTYQKRPIKKTYDHQLVCCILPLESEVDSKIYFPDSYTNGKSRAKRQSTKFEVNSPAQRQRMNLLRKYGIRSLTHTIQAINGPANIVSPDDKDNDPYWNIKNTNNQMPTFANNPQYSDKEDYDDDYIVEVPKPGLIGLYSDNDEEEWVFENTNKDQNNGDIDDPDVVDEEDEYSEIVTPVVSGYGTINPRNAQSRLPAKLTTTSSDEFNHVGDGRVTYQTNPDFHLLDGFKLPNLVRGSVKAYTRVGYKHSGALGVDSSDSEDSEGVIIDAFEEGLQLYRDCGKAAESFSGTNDNKQIGYSTNGSHPWLALVVNTRRNRNVRCYATLVHPRAAVTTGDCVVGTTPGQLTLLAGMWSLSESHKRWQKRLVTTTVHPLFELGDMANNLAILHWKSPLRMSGNVQPVCLGDPHVGDDCKFYGWGGFETGAVRHRSRWQRGSILSPRSCATVLPPSKCKTLPKDAFCVTSQTTSSVTGPAGPLVCQVGDRHIAVGVATRKEQAIIAQPLYDWVLHTVRELRIR